MATQESIGSFQGVPIYGGSQDSVNAQVSAINAKTVSAPVSQTQDASQINQNLSGQSSSVSFPPAPGAPTTGISNNIGIPSPTPSAADIINQGNTQTPAEKTNQTLLQKVASLIGSSKGQTTLTNQAEQAAGVPGLQKIVNDLNTQLEGLNNQALDLQNQAAPGGAIQNQEQQNVLGRGVTTGGLAPLTAGDLRKNQIQQSAIASQALTLKSAIYGAQGNLTLAKDAADKAAQAQYEDQQNQIAYQQALIQANLPQMTKEEKNQALLVQSQLQDRQTQIQNAQEDKKSIIALATAALKNNPNDPQAQYAAQQALALSNQEKPDLAKAMQLLGKYQSDPIATQTAYYNMLKARNDAQTSTGLSGSVSPEYQPYVNAFQNAIAGLGPQKSAQATQVLQQYLKNGDTAGARAYIVRTALANASTDQQNQAIGRSQALTAMNDIQSLLAQAKAAGSDTNILSGSIVNAATKLGASPDTNLSYIGSRILQALITYRKAMTGVAFGPQEAADYKKIFPDITNIESLNTAKINALKDSLNANNRAALSFYIGDDNYNQLFGSSNTDNLPGGNQDFASTPPNYTADLAAAKAAIAAGADPVAVKQRMLTKYKEVDL